MDTTAYTVIPLLLFLVFMALIGFLVKYQIESDKDRCPSCDSRDITIHGAEHGSYSCHCLRCWHVWRQSLDEEPPGPAEKWWRQVGEATKRRIAAIVTAVVTGILYVKLRRTRRREWEMSRDDTAE